MTIELVKFERKPDDNAVKHLERLMERARAGEIDSISYATLAPDGGIGAGYSIAPNQSFRMVASTLRLLRKIEAFAFE